MSTGSGRRRRSDASSSPDERRSLGALGLAVAVVVLVAVAPDPVPVGGARFLARVALVAGASVTVARAGAVDLGVAAVAGVGAVVGGVLPAVAGWPALVGVPLGAAAGALVGAATGALHGRTGRQLGALATLAVGAAVVATLRTLDVVGGVGGFHAVGLPTGAGDLVDALAVGACSLVVVVLAARVARTRRLAAAAVATRDPAVAASIGRSPVADVAVAGAGGGALLAAAAVLLATVDGSVVPDAYGLELTAALVVAATVGGAGPAGPALGAALVWGPATLFPLAPVVGTLPVLVTAGPLALLLLALRGGRPLTAPPRPRSPSPRPEEGAATGARPAVPDGPVLRLRGVATPSGPVHLEVAAGEVVALVGPNGAGKSTLLARVGGQLPDHGRVLLADRPAPRGPRRRARAGIARTWQRPPQVEPADALASLPTDGAGADAAVDGAVAALGADLAATPGGAQLVRLVALRPAVALVDEPTDVPPERLATLLRQLAGTGTAIVLVDHRPEVVDAADRVHQLGAAP